MTGWRVGGARFQRVPVVSMIVCRPYRALGYRTFIPGALPRAEDRALSGLFVSALIRFVVGSLLQH